jgi:hypothetical protein
MSSSIVAACLLADIFVAVVPAQDQPNKVQQAFQEAQSAVSSHCPAIELKLDAKGSRCSRVMARNPLSEVCYLETDRGFFFVTHDLLDSASVTYNRWD